MQPYAIILRKYSAEHRFWSLSSMKRPIVRIVQSHKMFVYILTTVLRLRISTILVAPLWGIHDNFPYFYGFPLINDIKTMQRILLTSKQRLVQVHSLFELLLEREISVATSLYNTNNNYPIDRSG